LSVPHTECIDQSWTVEDEIHAELIGEHPSRGEALNEIRRRAALPWDALENRAPCTNWRNCGREYTIISPDGSVEHVVRVEALGVHWLSDAQGL
jgi:hypothetical protein